MCDSSVDSFRYKKFFIWYCCIIGIIGNTYICIKLAQQVARLRKTKKRNNSERHRSRDDQENLPESKSSFDRKHNMTIFYYLIGLNLSDTLVIINWILSLLQKNVLLDQNFTFQVNEQNMHEDLALNLNDFLNGYNYISDRPTSSYVEENFRSINLNHLNNMTEYFMRSMVILTSLRMEKKLVSTQLINIQGVCQLHYYLTIISLYGSLCYTLACLFDRLFRLGVIYKNFDTEREKRHLQEEIGVRRSLRSQSAFTESNLRESKCYSKQLDPHNSIAYELEIESGGHTESLKNKKFHHHSELVRQLFGKSSSILIFLVVIYFNIHLLWMYGSIQIDKLTYSPPVSYQYLFKNQSNSSLIGYPRTDDLFEKKDHQYGYIVISTIQPVCKLLNIKNSLPILVMAFSLFLLLMLSMTTILLTCLIIQKMNSLKKKKQNRKRLLMKQFFEMRVTTPSNQNSTKQGSNRRTTSSTRCHNFSSSKVKSDEYTLTKCILLVTIFGALMNTPSLIARNFLMIGIVQSEDNSELAATFIKEENTTSSWFDWKIFQAYISSLCDKLDLLLLFSSSHKFFIILFTCHFIQVPWKRCCHIKCKCNW